MIELVQSVKQAETCLTHLNITFYTVRHKHFTNSTIAGEAFGVKNPSPLLNDAVFNTALPSIIHDERPHLARTSDNSMCSLSCV